VQLLKDFFRSMCIVQVGTVDKIAGMVEAEAALEKLNTLVTHFDI